MEQGTEGKLTMARVDLSSRLSSLIPTEEVEPVTSETESATPILTVLPDGAGRTQAAPKGASADADSSTEEDDTQAISEVAPSSRSRKRGAAAREPRSSRARSATASVSDAEEPTVAKGVGVLLPESLDARLRRHHDATGKSFPTIVMDAVESTYNDLPSLIARATGREAEPARVSLFGRSAKAERRVGSSEPSVRHTIRLSERNVKVLDELTDDMGAPSRTLLIVTALDAYLP